MKVIASRQIPIVNTHQGVWQPVAENGDLSMRLAPIDWQPSGAHACIQMLVDDLRDAEAKLAKAAEALQFASAELLIIGVMGSYPTALPAANKARAMLDELEIEPLGAEFEAVWDANKGELYEP